MPTNPHNNTNAYHIPIMVDQVLAGLDVRDGGLYLDGTLGGGGHTSAILTAHSHTRVIGFDRDTDAIAHATARLAHFGDRLVAVHADYRTAPDYLATHDIRPDGILLDLGISSHQVDCPQRGFSYRFDAPLDMRMDATDWSVPTAQQILAVSTEAELANIFFRYGDEKFSRRIARAIVERRVNSPIRTTGQLVELITSCVPHNPAWGHPAKRVFQALRIQVNAELEGLDTAIERFVDCLAPGGRIAIIAFHSTEDRIVKNTLRTLATDCICSKKLPLCVCGHRASIRLISKHTPSSAETIANPRCTSAMLRIAQKIQ